MKVLVSKTEWSKFRQRVRRAYPKERIELIWGRKTGPSTFHIHLFDHVKHKATTLSCTPDEKDVEVSEQEAKECGLVLLGTVHSHPERTEAAPSETDFDSAVEDFEIISGIAAVWKDKSTGRLRTRIRFWAPLLGVTAELV